MVVALAIVAAAEFLRKPPPKSWMMPPLVTE